MSQPPALTPEEQHLNNLWQEHLRTEFSTRSADEAIATMVANPLVKQVPVMIGGDGKDELYQFYAKYFLPQIPPDTEMVPVSRTIGQGDWSKRWSSGLARTNLMGRFANVASSR